MNLTGQKRFSQDKVCVIFSYFLNFHKDKSFQYFLFFYLNFKVTTANTTVSIVITQNRTAILLSWYPNF